MAGSSSRRGAVRKAGSKKGATVGSGGQRRKALKGKGPTPKAADRTYHKAHKQAKAGARREAARAQRSPRRDRMSSEIVAGRNSVLEAMRSEVPVTTLYIASRLESDDRVSEVLKLAAQRSVPVLRHCVRTRSAHRRGRPSDWPSRSRPTSMRIRS